MIDQRERIAREGMYRPDFEGDACGGGMFDFHGSTSYGATGVVEVVSCG